MLSFFGAGKSSSSEEDDSSSSWDSDRDTSVYGKSSFTSGNSTIFTVGKDNASTAHSSSTAPSLPERKATQQLVQVPRTGRQEKMKDVANNSVTEVNYDTDCTRLFSLIQDKNWEEAALCAKRDPLQIQIWVYRKELDDPNKLRWRLLPIHAMCVFVAPEFLMELLLDNYPMAASMTDDQGMLPIHLACRNGSAKGVVKLLLDTYPEGLYAKDRKGRTPIDFARASSNFNKEGIIMTLERFQATLEYQQKQKDGSHMTPPLPVFVKSNGPQEVNYENRTTLLRNIIKRDWKAVISRTKQFPVEASVWTKTKGVHGDIRFLPIHKICVLNPPLDVVGSLINAYPESASALDQDGWLPLHCAAYYRASEPVISFLIGTNLDACKTKDEEGRVPIHYACMKKLPYTVIQKLVNACPKSLKLKDNEGYTPLHLASGHGCSPDVVEILLDECPKSAQSRDDHGRLPLHHLCCNSEVSEDDAEAIVRMLLKAFKSAVTVQDDQGKLPMHYACENRNIGKVALSLLYAAYPKAVEVEDGFGYTPITTAQAFGNNLDSLLSSFEGDTKKGNEENNIRLKEADNDRQKHGSTVPHIRSPLSDSSLQNTREYRNKSDAPKKSIKNNDVGKKIVSRLDQLENVFGEAVKSMQSQLSLEEDASQP